MRPLIEADLAAAYDLVAPTAVRIINEGRECAPQLCIFQMDDRVAGQIARVDRLPEALVRYMHRAPGGKDRITLAIKATLGTAGVDSPVPLRALLIDGGLRPDIVVYVQEAWTTRTLPPGHPDKGKSPSERADRQDSLVVMVYVRDYTYGGFTAIDRVDGKRVVKLTPFDPGKMVVAGGRMSIQQDEEMLRKAGGY